MGKETPSQVNLVIEDQPRESSRDGVGIGIAAGVGVWMHTPDFNTFLCFPCSRLLTLGHPLG